MAETTTLTIEVPKATADGLAELARSSNRTTAALAQQALDQFLDVEKWHRKAVQEALAELDAGGPLIAHEDMDAYLEALAKGEDPPPPPTFMPSRE